MNLGYYKGSQQIMEDASLAMRMNNPTYDDEEFAKQLYEEELNSQQMEQSDAHTDYISNEYGTNFEGFMNNIGMFFVNFRRRNQGNQGNMPIANNSNRGHTDEEIQQIADNLLTAESEKEISESKIESKGSDESMDQVALVLSQMDVKCGSNVIDCSICWKKNKLEDECVHTYCKHEFHFKCLTRCLQFSSKCPNCNKELIQIYFV